MGAASCVIVGRRMKRKDGSAQMARRLKRFGTSGAVERCYHANHLKRGHFVVCFAGFHRRVEYELSRRLVLYVCCLVDLVGLLDPKGNQVGFAGDGGRRRFTAHIISFLFPEPALPSAEWLA